MFNRRKDSKPLKLLAEDRDDLLVISAALQDGVFKVGDLSHDPKARRLSLVLNRFRREAAADKAPGQRVQSVLAIDSVLSIQSRKIRLGPGDLVAQILALQFHGADGDGSDPSGALHLVLAGGAEIRIVVECVDVTLSDISPAWTARARPDHGE